MRTYTLCDGNSISVLSLTWVHGSRPGRCYDSDKPISPSSVPSLRSRETLKVEDPKVNANKISSLMYTLSSSLLGTGLIYRS